MHDFVYLDFEFNDAQVLCCVIQDADGTLRFDLRQPGHVTALAHYVAEKPGSYFVAYAATAEMESILRLGIALPDRWIDLMPEAYQLSMTHPLFRNANGFNPKALSMLAALSLFTGLDQEEAKDHKERMRNLILGQQSWSDAEFASILDYCESDVVALPVLWERIQNAHHELATPWQFSDAHYRGRIQRACAILRHRSPGMPVAPEWLASIYEHKIPIIHAQVDEVSRVLTGYALFSKTETGAKVNFAECARYATEMGIAWAVSDKTGKPLINEDYLDDFCKACPSLRPFKEARDLFVQLAKNRWLEGDAARHEKPLIQNGCVQPISVQFYTKTGRAQPLVNRGHILNARPFIRTSIRPPEGKVIVAADWSQQEIAIALHEFPDARLRAAYETRNAKGKRDIYTALATMAGAIHPGMDDDAVALVRQSYKAVQLGLGYGMGAGALGRKLYVDLNAGRNAIVISRDEANAKAESIYLWHKRTFSEYWAGVDRFVEMIRKFGHYVNSDGWIYFANSATPETQLRNIKMQGNGASMLHFALADIAKTDIQYIADHHDAIYALADEDQGEAVGQRLKAIMDGAAQKVIGTDIDIAVDVKLYDHASGYTDPRATAMVNLLNTRLTATNTGRKVA